MSLNERKATDISLTTCSVACNQKLNNLIPFDNNTTLQENSKCDTYIKLEPETLARLQDLAAKRNDKAPGTRSNRIATDKSDLDIHIEGLLGEYAFSQYFGLPIDETMYKHSGDNGSDFTFGKAGIQVKYNPRIGGDLLIPAHRPVNAKIIVLTAKAADTISNDIHNPCVEVVGWIKTFDFYKLAAIKIYNCNTYMLRREYLRPAEVLKQYMKDHLEKVELEQFTKDYLKSGGRN